MEPVANAVLGTGETIRLIELVLSNAGEIYRR
jgi:hypothetical protein